MINKSPAFQFYVNDWLSSTNIALMTPAEEGAYIRLLAHMWNDSDCCLPNDDEILARLSRLNEGWFNGGSTVVKKCFKFFDKEKTKLTNERLLKERKKQNEWRKKSQKGGLKSSKIRQKKRLKGGSKMVHRMVEPPYVPPYIPFGNSSSSSSYNNIYIYAQNLKKIKKTDINESIYKSLPLFLEFWKIYPRPIDKKKACWAYIQCLINGTIPEQILKYTQRYIDQIEKDNIEVQYIKHPTTFLNSTEFGEEEPAEKEQSPANDESWKETEEYKQYLEGLKC